MFRYEEPPRKVLVREATEHFNRAMMMTIYSLKCTNLLLINQKRNECHDEFDDEHRGSCNQLCRSITPSDRGQVKEKVENDYKVCPCINSPFVIYFSLHFSFGPILYFPFSSNFWSRFDCLL